MKLFTHYIFNKKHTVLASMLLIGCSAVPRLGTWNDFKEEIAVKTQYLVEKDAEQIQVLQDTISSLLGEPLTVDSAVQIALLNNPSLQVVFEELGIAQSDLLQAGLLANPKLKAQVLSGGGDVKTELGIEQDFMGIFLRPLRIKLGEAQYQAVKYRVGHEVFALIAHVRESYYMLQGDKQLLTLLRSVVEAAEAAKELAQRQYNAGNISMLDLSRYQANYHQVKLALIQNEIQVEIEQDVLNRKMGLTSTPLWKIKGVLSQFSEDEPVLLELVSRATENRMDLQALEAEIKGLEEALSWARFNQIAEGELGFGQEKKQVLSSGPELKIAVPIFDLGQAEAAKKKAELRQKKKQMKALRQEIHTEVGILYKDMVVNRKTVDYFQKTIIPVNQQIVESAQKHYNFMLQGVYTLLESKQDEINAHRDYIEALKSYWITRSKLDFAIGGGLEFPLSGEEHDLQESMQN
ncbi:MAG: TolC family protein [Candidatus Marinimicrobia bacterium]|nr:TolC family protein [Candidatus Neomarinimicrobiota bacterium]